MSNTIGKIDEVRCSPFVKIMLALKFKHPALID